MEALDKEPKHRVQLHISLVDLDGSPILKFKHPQVKVSWLDRGNRCGAITNLKPGITTPEADSPIELEYQFEAKQTLSIAIIDTGLQSEFSTQDITVGSLLTSSKRTLTLDLMSKTEKVPGKVSLTITPYDDGTSETAVIGFSCRQLAKKDTFSESDPYLVIYSHNDKGELVQIHRTERYDDQPNPVFKKFEISMETLCNGKRDKALLIKVWDYDKLKDDLIGSVKTTFEELATGQELVLYGPKQENNGYIKADIVVNRKNNFVDYLLKGLNLQLSVAVDFTSSNGELKNPQSLHTRKGGIDNHYQKAMREISERILRVTGTKEILAMGFGAFPHFNDYNDISHCFPLAQKEWHVKDLPSLLRAYEDVRSLLKFNGFTLYEEIITKALERAKTAGTKLLYSVAVILTDGDVTDPERVNKLLDEAADLPISFLVVGFGDQSFPHFQDLSQGTFADTSKEMKRRVLNFAVFDEDVSKGVEELLKPLPGQITEYFQLKRI